MERRCSPTVRVGREDKSSPTTESGLPANSLSDHLKVIFFFAISITGRRFLIEFCCAWQ
jgi:hypothetical protein